MTGDPLELVDASAIPGRGPVWGAASTDLNATVLVWAAGTGQPDHVNEERDVAIVVLEGSGTITVDADVRPLVPGTLAIVPRGAHRSVVAGPDGLRCVTVHRRRGGLQITGRTPRTTTGS